MCVHVTVLATIHHLAPAIVAMQAPSHLKNNKKKYFELQHVRVSNPKI